VSFFWGHAVTTNPLIDTVALTITRLGAQGDGVAETLEGPVFVPYVLPGEQVQATLNRDRGIATAIERASADRTAPVCRHFTVCGGCAMQHLAIPAQLAWKAGLVATALSQQGLTPPLSPLVATGLAARRRAVFTARRTKSSCVLGFHEARLDEIVDLAVCPILSPDIASRLPALRALVLPMLSRSGEARVTVTVADNGVDVAVTDARPELSSAIRSEIADLARAARVIRVSIAGDTVFSSLEPVITFGRASVIPPPGVFLQAVPSAEAAMTALILAAVPKARRVADLFCGLGTFTFPLSERADVLAVDGDRAAVTALADAYRRAQGLKPVTTLVRDLFREPLSEKELEPFDAVVFDPPRAGADAQVRRIAKSKVGTVVAVSCAPSTLARDLKTLCEGGFTIESVTPVDQFLFSAHVEAVAVLRRPKRRKV
jgi:23S rRNA (uracil1939-C5)-methyltransferase